MPLGFFFNYQGLEGIHPELTKKFCYHKTVKRIKEHEEVITESMMPTEKKSVKTAATADPTEPAASLSWIYHSADFNYY